jgi:hypothetical protein
VPSVSFSRFNVTPPGTCRSERTIVEQDFLDTLADEYPNDPLNVHDALLAKACSALGAEVIMGITGFAKTPPAPKRATVIVSERYMAYGYAIGSCGSWKLRKSRQKSSFKFEHLGAIVQTPGTGSS